jgi:hypothetical protein
VNESKLKKIGDRLARDPRVQRHHFIIVNADGTYMENWSGYGGNNADRPMFSMLPMTDEGTYGQGNNGIVDAGSDGVTSITDDNDKGGNE